MTTHGRPARVTVIHADRPSAAVTRSMVEALEKRDIETTLLRLATQPLSATNAHQQADLFVLKHSDEAALTAAGVLHNSGAATFNPYPVVAICRDKAATTSRLAAAGLPTPPTWLVSDPESASPLLRDGPVVVKPYNGSKGVGVTVARRRADLCAIEALTGPFLIQRYQEPEGLDRKLYSVGGQLFCVGRPWPAITPEDKQGRLLEVDAVLRRVATGVGRALGIDTFGADVVISDGQAWLVDVSSFPGFKGVPDVGQLLAARIARALDQLNGHRR